MAPPGDHARAHKVAVAATDEPQPHAVLKHREHSEPLARVRGA